MQRLFFLNHFPDQSECSAAFDARTHHRRRERWDLGQKVRAWQFEMDFQVLDCKQVSLMRLALQLCVQMACGQVIFINRFDIWHLRTALVHRMGAAGANGQPLPSAVIAGTTPGIS